MPINPAYPPRGELTAGSADLSARATDAFGHARFPSQRYYTNQQEDKGVRCKSADELLVGLKQEQDADGQQQKQSQQKTGAAGNALDERDDDIDSGKYQADCQRLRQQAAE